MSSSNVSRIHMISPRFRGEKALTGKIGDLIDIYEDRVNGWLLAPARSLLTTTDGRFAALALCLAYFEGSAIYRSGTDSKGKSKQFFRTLFLSLFCRSRPAPGHEDTPMSSGFHEQLADTLYEDGRCGMFHGGFPKEKILLATASAPLTTAINKDTGEISCVVIDVDKFLARIEGDFLDYVAALRDPNNHLIRQNFRQAWNLNNPTSPLLLPPGPIP